MNKIFTRNFVLTAWNLAGALALRCSSLIIAVASARLLKTQGYGELAIVNSTTLLLSSLAGFGLGITCTRSCAAYRESPERVSRIVSLALTAAAVTGSVASLSALALAPFLSAFIHAPHLVPELRLTALTLFSDTLAAVLAGVIAGFEGFRELGRLAVIQASLSLPLSLLLVFRFGLRGAVLALVMTSFIGMALQGRAMLVLCRENHVALSLKGIGLELPLLWRQAFPNLLSALLVPPLIWLGNSALTAAPNGFSELGIFNAAGQWRNLLAFLPGVIGAVMLPLLSREQGAPQGRLEAANMLAGWCIVTILAWPLLAFPELAGEIFGKGYQNESYRSTMIPLLLVSCAVAYKEGVARKLIAEDLMWWGLASNVLWGAVFCLALFVIRPESSPSLAKIYLISYVGNTLLFMPLYFRWKIAPRRLLLSTEVIAIWSCTVLQACISLQGWPLSWKIPATLLLLSGVLFFFLRLWRLPFERRGA